MHKRIRNRMPEENRKTASISIRCTPEMEKRIKAKADQLGESVSEFAMVWIEAGIKRNTRYDRKKARELVEIQEAMNHMIQEAGSESKEIKAVLEDLAERMVGLWDF